MSDLTWTGPFAHRDALSGDGLSLALEDRSEQGIFDLRIGPKDAAARAAVSKALGFELPAEPRTSVSRRELTVLWMSVDQWLVCGDRTHLGAVANMLEGALAGSAYSLADVSDMRAVLRLTGDTVRPVLAKCCPVDVFDAAFAPGFVRRVTFGEIAAALHVVSDTPDTVDLYVFRSFADYALDWIREAAREGRTQRLFTEQRTPSV